MDLACPEATEISEARRGNPAARDALVSRCLPPVLQWYARLGGPRVDAEDAAHDVMIVLLSKLHALREPEQFPSWLFGVTRRVLAQHRRRAWMRRWVPGLVPDVPDGSMHPGQRAELSESNRRVQRALEDVPEAQRGVGLAAFTAAAFSAYRAAPDAALSGPLASETWRAIEPTPHVELNYQGKGNFAGTRRAPAIEWEAGTLRVEVEPEQGIDLAVHTAEADVRVIGTGFAVTRDALGTAVSVSHGRVAVVCQDGSDALLGSAESHVCLPMRPGGLLGRANGLVDHGAPPDQVLDAAERGLAAGAEGPIRAELILLRVQALRSLGRAAEGLAAAEAWLASGETARRGEMRHLAARSAMVAGGCTQALPHLESLFEEGGTGPELVQFAECIATERPVLAREALLRALRLGVPGDQESAIIERLTRLDVAAAP